MTDAPVVLVPYDTSWPEQFERERELLAEVIGDWLVGPIEHVGSTAIPGLAAKPVIDIMAGVGSLEASRPAIDALSGVGYCYFPYRMDVEHWFCKPSPAARTHHLHLVPHSSQAWNDCIAFRDYLRTHSGDAQEYQQLKTDLAVRHRLDREAYTNAKTAFVNRILDLVGR
jgi:GrpB-like predicted nucleotidyltransferase (UPF0157 family)